MRFSPICCVILALTSLLAGFADDKSSATVDTQAPAAKKKGAETGDSKKQDSKKGDAARLKKAVAENARFLRLRNNDKGDPVAMETSITRYESDRYPGVTVDLIGVVHIADKGYYDKLNKLFEQYDALLYELVAPEGARPIKGQKRQGTSALSGMQRMMKDMLDLQFQLDCIDYQKKNFVHADMSPAEFTKSMNKRGESFSQLFFRMMGQSMAQQGGGSTDLQFLFALVSRDRSARLKRVMAKQFQQMEATMYALNGPDGTTIINERNKKALDVMREQMGAGKRRLAVFYGAGHLPDMERRLEGDFGFRRRGSHWLVAWDLTE